MTDDTLNKLRDIVNRNNGKPTSEEIARREAVDYLAGRTRQQEQLRPGADALVKGIRGQR